MDHELEQQMGGGRARARACNIIEQIINAKPSENQFTRADKNIAAAATLLETLLDLSTPEALRVQRRMAELLAKAMQHQASDAQCRVA